MIFEKVKPYSSSLLRLIQVSPVLFLLIETGHSNKSRIRQQERLQGAHTAPVSPCSVLFLLLTCPCSLTATPTSHLNPVPGWDLQLLLQSKQLCPKNTEMGVTGFVYLHSQPALPPQSSGREENLSCNACLLWKKFLKSCRDYERTLKILTTDQVSKS